jgi:hypothetical protein
VYLDDQSIQVDFGLSQQAASYKLAFEGNGPAYLILSSGEGVLNWNGEALSGYQELGNDTRVFIYLLPDKFPVRVTALQNKKSLIEHQAAGKDACLVLDYENGPQELLIH